MNHKRIQRRYRREGFAVRRRRRNRVALGGGGGPELGEQPSDCWCLACVRGTLASGRRFRALSVLDTCTREALASEVETSLPGARVVRVLDEVITERGRPEPIVLDNGPELISRVLDQWAYDHHIQLQFIDPGKPIQNAFIESFNGRFRDACLNAQWFTGVADAQALIEDWRLDDNIERPQSALGYQTPKEVYQGFIRPLDRLALVGLSE